LNWNLHLTAAFLVDDIRKCEEIILHIFYGRNFNLDPKQEDLGKFALLGLVGPKLENIILLCQTKLSFQKVPVILSP